MNPYNTPAIPFKIRFIEPVVFKDWNGTITHTFEVGDTFDATHDTGIYYVTCLGGIYHTEAERV